MSTDLEQARRQRAIRKLSHAVGIVAVHATIDERLELRRLLRFVALGCMPIDEARTIVTDMRRDQDEQRAA